MSVSEAALLRFECLQLKLRSRPYSTTTVSSIEEIIAHECPETQVLVWSCCWFLWFLLHKKNWNAITLNRKYMHRVFLVATSSYHSVKYLSLSDCICHRKGTCELVVPWPRWEESEVLCLESSFSGASVSILCGSETATSATLQLFSRQSR